MPHGPWTHRTICQLSVLGTAFGQRIVNVFHFQAEEAKETTLTNDTLAQAAGTALANAWITGEKPEYRECVAVEYNMQMVRAQILERNAEVNRRLTPSEIISTGTGSPGLGASSENLTTSGVVRWRTPLAGKSFRGRTYFGPIPTTWVADGMLVGAGVTALDTFRTAMLATWGPTGAVVSGWRLTIYSKPYDQGEYGYVRGSGTSREFYYPPDYAGNATDVTTSATDPVLRVQRRREVGVGA